MRGPERLERRRGLDRVVIVGHPDESPVVNGHSLHFGAAFAAVRIADGPPAGVVVPDIGVDVSVAVPGTGSVNTDLVAAIQPRRYVIFIRIRLIVPTDRLPVDLHDHIAPRRSVARHAFVEPQRPGRTGQDVRFDVGKLRRRLLG